MIRHLRAALWVFLLCAACQWMAPTGMTPITSAWAAVPGVSCNATMTSISFGNVDTKNHRHGFHHTGNYNLNTTGYLTYYCTNTTATQQTVTACFSIGNPGGNIARAMNGPGGSTMDYNIYQDAARSIPWGSSYLPTWGNPVAVNVTVPPHGTSPPVTLPAYATITSDQRSSPGSYAATYGGGDIKLDIASGTNAQCTAGSGGGTITGFQVTAAVEPTCQVTTNPLTFPTPTGGNPSGATASSTLTVTCTRHTGYQVGLDNGKNFDGTNRRMRGGPTFSDYLDYGLFQDSADTIPWGNTKGTDTVTGTSDTQTFTVYGKVNANQGLPPAGNYFDVVTVYVYY